MLDRNPSHIYELRSYHLKPGTMVEWGNYWSKAIKLRDYQHTEAYMGCFSQIGELYNVKVRTEGPDRSIDNKNANAPVYIVSTKS